MDVELTDHNCSEVLRIFIKARNCKENEVHIKLFSLFLITETVRTLLKVISIIQCLCHKVVVFTDVFSHLVLVMDYLYYRIRIQIPNLKGTLYSAELVHRQGLDPYPDSDPQSLLSPFLGQLSVPRLGSESVSTNVNKPSFSTTGRFLSHS